MTQPANIARETAAVRTPTEIIGDGAPSVRMSVLKILCVEDNKGDFVLLKDHLKQAGFRRTPEIQGAKTLQAAIDMLHTNGDTPPFDVVFLDLSLPDSSGVQTYLTLRQASPRVAVIILSGNNDRDLAEEMVHEGAQDYLQKENITPDLLMRSAVYALSRQRYRVGLEKLAERLRKTTEELRTAQMHLAHVEKMDSISRLAAGVAHEVKNPLGTIQMGLDFLSNHGATLDANCARVISQMQEAVSRADAVIHDMLTFSRSEATVRMEPIVVNELVRAVLRMVTHDLNRGHVTCKPVLADDVPDIKGDVSKLEQVLINIIMNAMQAVKKGGHIHVRTGLTTAGDVPRDEGLRAMNLPRPGDPMALIEITDDGPGISQQIIGRIFEPFFTTKPTGEGTGLGLALSKRIIDLHRGQIEIDSAAAGTGACVRITIPAEVSDRSIRKGTGTTTVLKPAGKPPTPQLV